MTAYVALLRGVNVGGHNKLPMKELRALIEENGASDVASYIQSGNVVFNLKKSSPSAFQKKLSGLIEDEFGFRPGMMILDRKSFAATLKNNPFGKSCKEPSKLHILFLKSSAKAGDVKNVETVLAGGERIKASKNAIYLDAPAGIGRSKAAEMLARIFNEGTMRNWRTCLRLEEMLAEIS